MWINLSIGELEDPKGMGKDVSAVGYWGNGDYEIVNEYFKNNWEKLDG